MNDSKPPIWIAGLFLMAVFLGISLYGIYKPNLRSDEKRIEAEKYYKKYNISLKGYIVDKATVDNFASNHSVYIVKIATCNTREHDLREYLEDYYLLIHNDTARFVNHTNFADVGDSIVIDYAKCKQYVWKDNYANKESDDLSAYDLDNSFRRKAFGW